MDHGTYGNHSPEDERVRDTRLAALRASDAEREQMAALMRHHYAIGRLDTEEFEERVARCFAATTVGELQELVADLPPSIPGELGRARTSDRRRLLPRPAMIVPIVVALALLSRLTGGHALWLAWPLAFIVLR